MKSAWFIALSVAVVATVGMGEPIRVSTVEDLVAQLWVNRGNNATIMLATGRYDVSDYAMKTYNAQKQTEGDSVSHISISRVTLCGATDNPRDTVIYCNGTNTILYCYNGYVNNLTISNGCTKSSSSDGGGITALNDSTVMSNCVITCCKSLRYGGGVAIAKCVDCDICYNASTNSGAGTYRANLVRCRIFGNVSGKDGGGAHQTKVVGCRIWGNSAKENGGGVSNWYKNATTGKAQAWLYDSTVVSNIAATGGGAYNMVVSNSTVFCNTASNGGGIAYKTEMLDSWIVLDSWIANNVATGADGGGGGVYSSTEYEAVPLVRCEVAGNFTAWKGGGTYYANLEDSFIQDNFAADAAGGGCYRGRLVGGIVSNNVSGAGGTSLCDMTSVSNCALYAAPFKDVGAFVNCRICGYTNGWVLAEGENVATNGHFDGQATLSYGTFAARNTLFSGNRATYLFDGYHTTGMAFENCTVAGNEFNRTFYNFGSTAYGPCRIVNTIFAGNKSLTGASDYGVTFASGSQKLAFTNCLLGASSSSTTSLPYPPVGCIVGDNPRFDEMNADDPYSLLHASPAVGAGLVMGWMEEATDIRNDTRYLRLRDGLVDIGCYQCWLAPKGFMLLVR